MGERLRLGLIVLGLVLVGAGLWWVWGWLATEPALEEEAGTRVEEAGSLGEDSSLRVDNDLLGRSEIAGRRDADGHSDVMVEEAPAEEVVAQRMEAQRSGVADTQRFDRVERAMQNSTRIDSWELANALRVAVRSDWPRLREQLAELTEGMDEYSKIPVAIAIVDALPTDLAVEFLEDELYDLSDPRNHLPFLSKFSDVKIEDDESAEALLAVVDRILEHRAAVRAFDADPHGWILSGAIQIYGRAGDAGFERLAAMKFNKDLTLSAIAGMGTAKALEYVWNQYLSAEERWTQKAALTALAQHMDLYDNPAIREEVLQTTRVRLESEEMFDRLDGVRMAYFLGDLSLLPILRYLAESDEALDESRRDGLIVYPVRRDAQAAIEAILRTTELGGKVWGLQRREATLRSEIRAYERNLANGVDIELSERALASRKPQLEEVVRERAELEAQLEKQY